MQMSFRLKRDMVGGAAKHVVESTLRTSTQVLKTTFLNSKGELDVNVVLTYDRKSGLAHITRSTDG